ncbi:Stp1/IreP family PP2C-type Ser/Thr phosphatase, partial [bacterium]|nr:Stp1/IreP family PP2C-type Ser/Thr phosphatase [bacterium]MBU1025179.1 Stp1/IreP family PP2C-type Ser/Thr phosphatase [bacterium]
MKMNLIIASKTDTGAVREKNEDSVLAEILSGKSNPDCFMIVADGVGGNSAGEIASKLAVKQFGKYVSLIDNNQTDYEKFLKDTIRKINSEIIEKSTDDPEKWGMSTTFACGIIAKGKLYVAWAGDSRACVVRNGEILRITDDHSYVNELLKSGTISEEQARAHSRRNVITRSLGKNPDLDVDTNSQDLLDGDRVLFCTDGLTEYLTDHEIAYEICRLKTPDKACELLVDRANERGGKDNISIIVAHYGARKSLIPAKPESLKESEI